MCECVYVCVHAYVCRCMSQVYIHVCVYVCCTYVCMWMYVGGRHLSAQSFPGLWQQVLLELLFLSFYMAFLGGVILQTWLSVPLLLAGPKSAPRKGIPAPGGRAGKHRAASSLPHKGLEAAAWTEDGQRADRMRS